MVSIARTRSILDVRDLELVIALAESGSTVRASATLHRTQSAVSRGLLVVEDKLGTRLFERKARGLALTAAGRRLVSAAGPLIAQLVELEEHVRTGAAGTTPLRIVCECYTAYRWLPGALATLRGGMPRLDITIALDHTAAPVQALHAGEVDVALLTTGKVPAGILEQPLFTDEIVFVMAATHPLADRATIGPDDLRRHRLIVSTSTPEPERHWFNRRVFGRAEAKVDGLRFPLTESMIDAARAGMGVAPMSEWVAAPYVAAGDLVAKPLRGRRLHRPWRLAYRREVAAGAKQLAAALAGAPPRMFTAR
jgi:LysR family transcriptional regulator for metE and metH